MRRLLELAVTLAIGAGLPMSQLAIRHLGRRGAAGVAVVSAAVLAADVGVLARAGADGRGGSDETLHRVMRVEAATAAIATVTGVLLLLDPGVTEARDEGWRVGRTEMLRRLSLGLLFGIRSARFRLEAEQRQEVEPPAEPA